MNLPAFIACRRVGCVEMPTEPLGLCRHHWLELAEQAIRHELGSLRRAA